MADLFGLEIEDLPKNVTALEAVLVIKVMVTEETADFPYTLVSRCTGGLSIWEAEGMARYWTIHCEDQLRGMCGGRNDGDE